MAYTQNIDVDHGHLDEESSGYYANGFIEEQRPGTTFRDRIKQHELQEMQAALGIAS